MTELMTNVYWVFGKKSYAAYEEFVAAVTAYNKKISATNSRWDPNLEIARGPIKVCYEALWKDEDDTIELVIGKPDTPLTMGQVLFELNNATVEFFQDADRRFFEGLTLIQGVEYELHTGS